MRKQSIVISVIFMILSWVSVVHAREPLRIAYPTYPPFHWVNDNGRMKGFFYDIITEALEKRMSQPTIWTAYPWPRCQYNVKAGVEDAIMTVPTLERAKYTKTHKDPFYRKPLHIFTYRDHNRLKDILEIQTPADIRRKDLVMITYRGNGWHSEKIEPLGIKTYKTSYIPNVWKMLVQKRGDIVAEWPAAAWPDINRLDLGQKVLDTGIMIDTMAFHLLIRKGCPHTQLLPRFNAIILEMAEDGTIAEILSAYEVQ